MESYGKNEDKQQKKQEEREQQEEQKEQAQQKNASPAFAHAVQLLQAGAMLRDLPPEEAREVVQILGNQTVLHLMNGGGKPVPLAPEPPSAVSSTNTLLLTQVNIRWPMLCALPQMQRSGKRPGAVFSIENFRPMGQNTEGGVILDG